MQTTDTHAIDEGTSVEDTFVLKIDGFLFDLRPAVEVFELKRPQKIVVEGPAGFMRFAELITKVLRSKLGVEVLLRLDPAYGGCDVGYSFARRVGAELIVHLGHKPYPLLDPELKVDDSIDVVYIPGARLEDLKVLPVLASKLKEVIKAYKASKVCIGYVIQHELLARALAKELEHLDVRFSLSEVLGCYYSRAIDSSCDMILIISGGLFHVIGAGLYAASVGIQEVPLFKIDPYSESVESAKELVAKMLRKRYFKVLLLRNIKPRSVLVVVGAKFGQYRPSIVRKVLDVLSRHEISYTLSVSNELREEVLNNMPPHSFDAVVVTSCPRLAIDDLADYWKPVLTPGELVMALDEGVDARYRFWM